MLATGDVIRLVLTWIWGTDSVAQIVWHYICGSDSSTTYSDWLDNIETAIQLAWDNIEGYIDQALVGSTLEMLLWDFANNRWDGIASKGVSNLSGSANADYMPHGAAVLVKMLTALNRRQMRKYIPGLVESAVTDGFIDAAPLLAFVDFGDDFDVGLASGGGGITPGTFNTDDQSPFYETFSLAQDTSIVDAVVAYQRRRKPGVGLS